MTQDPFARIEWQSDRLMLDGFEYRFEKGTRGSPKDAPGYFRFYKNKPLLDQYQRFWKLHPGFQVKNLFEIGMWDGGSLAFWNDLLKPERHVAIDLIERTDSPYFQDFVKTRGRQDSIRTLWKTNQANRTQLGEIVNANFDGPLDLVFDDGSHMYKPTRASFETLFPLVRVGGFYIIEDWAWAHWSNAQDPAHPFSKERALTELIFELIEATGTNVEPIRSVSVYQGFAAIEKGILTETTVPFKLDDHIMRRPPPTPPPPAPSKPRSRVKRIGRRLREWLG